MKSLIWASQAGLLVDWVKTMRPGRVTPTGYGHGVAALAPRAWNGSLGAPGKEIAKKSKFGGCHFSLWKLTLFFTLLLLWPQNFKKTDKKTKQLNSLIWGGQAGLSKREGSAVACFSFSLRREAAGTWLGFSAAADSPQKAQTQNWDPERPDPERGGTTGIWNTFLT